jgi:hypothetical protein
MVSKIQADGQIEGICVGTRVKDDLVFYHRRPTPLSDVHGSGSVLLPSAEVIKLPR